MLTTLSPTNIRLNSCLRQSQTNPAKPKRVVFSKEGTYPHPPYPVLFPFLMSDILSFVCVIVSLVYVCVCVTDVSDGESETTNETEGELARPENTHQIEKEGPDSRDWEFVYLAGCRVATFQCQSGAGCGCQGHYDPGQVLAVRWT